MWQLPDFHLPTPYHLLIISYYGRSWVGVGKEKVRRISGLEEDEKMVGGRLEEGGGGAREGSGGEGWMREELNGGG